MREYEIQYKPDTVQAENLNGAAKNAMKMDKQIHAILPLDEVVPEEPVPEA